MTCIVGMVRDGVVHLGGDSAGVSGWDLTIRADSKVFAVGRFVFGFTSSYRMGQLLRYSLALPDVEPGDDLMQFMCTKFITAVRDCLKAGGFAKKEHDIESGGIFLVGVNGRLFRVDSDYQVGLAWCGYDAIGCGEAYAKGALFSTMSERDAGQPAFDPAERLGQALSAAEAHSAAVRGPFHFVRTP